MAAKMAQVGAQFCAKLHPKERCFSNTYKEIFFCGMILGAILVKPLTILDKPYS
jgi:hypothetical protein